jgi:hypothetical protein
MGLYRHIAGLLLLFIGYQWVEVAKAELVVVEDNNST